jgi:Flp pilus assembly pilin Flp
MLRELWKDEEALTTVEYALLLALVAIAAIAAWTLLGQRVNTSVTRVNNSLPAS